jgi:hypothetical protein
LQQLASFGYFLHFKRRLFVGGFSFAQFIGEFDVGTVFVLDLVG